MANNTVVNNYSIISVHQGENNNPQCAISIEYEIYPQLTAVNIVPDGCFERIYYLDLMVTDMGTATLISFGEIGLLSMKLKSAFTGYEYKAPEKGFINLKNKMIKANANLTGAVVSISGIAFPPDYDFRRAI